MPDEGADNGLIVAEPAGRYARKPPLVVDCSVLAAVLFDEPERDAAPSSAPCPGVRRPHAR